MGVLIVQFLNFITPFHKFFKEEVAIPKDIMEYLWLCSKTI